MSISISLPGNIDLNTRGIAVGGYNGAAFTTGRGALTQSGGIVTTSTGGDLALGFTAGSTGVYTLSGGALVANLNEYIGFSGTGTFNHSGGSNTVNASTSGFFSVGHNASATGTYNLSGTGSLTVNANEYLGYGGTGIFNQTGGAHTVGSVATNRDLYLAYNNATGSYSLSGSGSSLTVHGDEYIGYFGEGGFTQSDGTHTVGTVATNRDLYLGYTVSSIGRYILLGGTLTVNGSETIGYSRHGDFTQSGGTHTVSNTLSFGDSGGGRGVYVLSGGDLIVGSLENIAGGGSVDNSFTQTGGTHTVGDPASHTGLLSLAAFASSGASYSLTSGNLTVNGAEQVGGSGSATFTQSGGTNTIISGPDPYVGLYLATNPGGSGTYSLSGNGILSVTGDAYIGGYFDTSGGTGVMNLIGGTATISGTMKVWNTVGTGVTLAGASLSVGSLDTDGNAAHFNWTSGALNLTNSNLTIGSAGPLGTSLTIDSAKALTVSGTTTIDPLRALTLSGGSISTTTLINSGTFTYQSGSFSGRLLNQGAVHLAASFTATNGVQNDASMTVASGQTLTANGAGFDNRGTLLLNDATAEVAGTTFGNTGLIRGEGLITAPFHNNVGGELRAEPGKSLTLTGSGNTNAGQIRLIGGAVDFDADLTNNAGAFISGNGSLLTDGLTNHGTMNFAGTANVVGDVANSATGKVISGGGGATIFYDDVTNDGEIRTSTNGFTVFFGDVTGGGTFTGTGTVNFEGDLNPGNSPAAVPFAGDVGFGPAASLGIELGGLTPGTQYDRLVVAGSVSLDGTLAVSLIDAGAGLFEPEAGDSFDILDWGTLSGTFSAIQLPVLDGGLVWNTNDLYETGILSVVAPGLPGDYNQNGSVDAADYVVWRKNNNTTADLPNDPDGGTIGAAQYNTWRSNFGAPTGGAWSNNNNSVPEPTSCTLLIVAASVSFTNARRRLRAGR